MARPIMSEKVSLLLTIHIISTPNTHFAFRKTSLFKQLLEIGLQ